MKLSDDSTRATLNIAGTLSTAEVETLITDLMVMRARMIPAVPLQRPKPSDAVSDDTRATLQPDPHLTIAAQRDGSFRIWIRNEGAGWMVYGLDAAKAEGFAKYILSRIPSGPRGPDLFGKKLTDGDKPH